MFFKIKGFREGSLNRKALKKFASDKLAMSSAFLLMIIALISMAGYVITPDKTPYSNEQHLELAARKPGFSVTMLWIAENKVTETQSWIKSWISGKVNNYRKIPVSGWHFSNDSIVVTAYEPAPAALPLQYSFSIYDVVYALAEDNTPISIQPKTDLNGTVISKDVSKIRKYIVDNHLKKQTFWLGTDRFGRDMLSQLVIGGRVSLSVGFISVLISLILGILLGSLSGFFRGWVDHLIIWFINVIWSIPTLLLVIAITFALGKGFWQVFIAVGLTMWVEVARIVRGQIMGLREKEYVEAARAMGFKNMRIIFKHILPNALSPVIVISAANFASAILIEAGLSFLGVGVQPPMPSWGTMIRENYSYIILDNPWLAILPGLCIMIVVLTLMMTGNGLRDALDVKNQSTG